MAMRKSKLQKPETDETVGQLIDRIRQERANHVEHHKHYCRMLNELEKQRREIDLKLENEAVAIMDCDKWLRSVLIANKVVNPSEVIEHAVAVAEHTVHTALQALREGMNSGPQKDEDIFDGTE